MMDFSECYQVAASLLGSSLSGRGVIRAREGVI